jgi:ferredoxin-NADP reductase
MLENYLAKVVEIIQETNNTKRFFLKVPDHISSTFKPGQFITLDLPISEKKAKRMRSYSIANEPNTNNILELVIVLLDGGLGTTYLFNNVVVGSELAFKGPNGHFVLPSDLNAPLYLICTGTGIAPFRSMIKYLQNQNLCNFPVSLIMGTRQKKDLLYHDELLELMHVQPNFKYIPVLSREQWQGESGYVHQVYQALATQQPNAQFMLCGWRAMIDEARSNLEQMGFAKNQIHFELYG